MEVAAVVIAFMFGVGVAGGEIAPTPYNLTDACKAQTVKAEGTNYSYSSFENCLKK